MGYCPLMSIVCLCLVIHCAFSFSGQGAEGVYDASRPQDARLLTWQVGCGCVPYQWSWAVQRLFFVTTRRVTGLSYCGVLSKSWIYAWRHREHGWISGFLDVDIQFCPPKGHKQGVDCWSLPTGHENLHIWSETSCGFNLLPWCRM